MAKEVAELERGGRGERKRKREELPGIGERLKVGVAQEVLVYNDETLTLPLGGPDEISQGHSRHSAFLIVENRLFLSTTLSLHPLSPSISVLAPPFLRRSPFVPSLSVCRLSLLYSASR